MARSICEEEIFKSIFSEQSQSLINFLYYKSGDYAASEDIMQDAFGTLWKECAKVTIGKAKSFLFTVANNLFLNKVKHEKVVLKFEQRSHKQINHENPQFILEEAEFKKRLEKTISSLPEGQRVVFLMNRIDKLKYKEIAERLGISVKAVEKRMHKALQVLRKTSSKL